MNWQPKPGEKNPKAKLTWVKVREIRSKAACGVKKKELAKMYKVALRTISAVVKREHWREDGSLYLPEGIEVQLYPDGRKVVITMEMARDLHSLLSEILNQREKHGEVEYVGNDCRTGTVVGTNEPGHTDTIRRSPCHSGSQEPQEEKKCPQKQCWVCDRNEPPKEPSIIPYEEGMPVDSQAGLVNEPCHQEKTQEEKLPSERIESIYLNKVEEEKPDNPSGLGKVWMYIGSIGEFLDEQSKKK